MKKLNLNVFYCIFFLTTLSFLKYFPSFTQYGNLDPNLYFGYIHHYKELYDLYGLTYYSTRLAYIFPSIVFMKIFGLELGLLFSSTVCIFLIQFVLFNFTKKNIYSFFIILFITLFSTLLLRIGSWTSYELHAISYIFLMHLFLFSNTKYKYFFVGLFFYFASNCNLFFSAIVSLSILSYFISQFKISMINIVSKKNSNEILLFFFGIIIGLLLLTLIHYYLNGFTKFHFLEKAQFNISYQLMNGLSKNWFKDFETIFNSQIFFLYPFVYFYFLSVSLFFNKDLFKSNLFKYSFVYLFNLLIFAVFMHYIFDRPWFAWWFKIIYFIVPCFLASLSILEAENNNNFYKHSSFLILMFILFYIIYFFDINFSLISLSTYKLILIFVILIYPFIHLSVFKKYKIFSTFFIIVITPIILSFSGSMNQIFKISNSYEKLSNINKRNLELANCMKYFQDSVIKNIDTTNDKKIKFIYSNNKPYLSSIQSTFLWGYSKVQVDINNLSLDANYNEKIEKFSNFFILSDIYDEFEIIKKDLIQKGFKNNTEIYECGSIGKIYFSGFAK